MSIEAVGWLRRSAGIDVAGTSTPIVLLNVGGVLYFTTAKTLAPFADACGVFRDAVSGSGRRGSDGALVVDRDGAVFRHVLNYMRSAADSSSSGVTSPPSSCSPLVLPDDFAEWDLLLADSRYYGLKGLEAAIAGNYDYQRRSFRRQLPSSVMLRWAVEEEEKECDAPPKQQTRRRRHTSIVLCPPIPALSIGVAPPQQTAGGAGRGDDVTAEADHSFSGAVLLHQGHPPLTTLEEALAVLCTSYGYKVNHWQHEPIVTSTMAVGEEGRPAEQQQPPSPSLNGGGYFRKASPPIVTSSAAASNHKSGSGAAGESRLVRTQRSDIVFLSL